MNVQDLEFADPMIYNWSNQRNTIFGILQIAAEAEKYDRLWT